VRVKVDPSRCQGHNRCLDLAPDFFVDDELGYASAIGDGEVRPDQEREAQPAIREVALVGYPDERLGERGCAIIVAEEPAPTLDDLQLYLAEAGMAKQYWPERIKIVNEMPKTPAGKVQKYVLREELAKETGGTVFDS